MFLGPHLICVAPRAGCEDIFGNRSSRVPSTVSDADGPVIDDIAGRKEVRVGRRGVMDVKVLVKLILLFCSDTLLALNSHLLENAKLDEDVVRSTADGFNRALRV